MNVQKYVVLVEIPEEWSGDDSVENLCRTMNEALGLSQWFGVFDLVAPNVRPLSTEVSC